MTFNLLAPLRRKALSNFDVTAAGGSKLIYYVCKNTNSQNKIHFLKSYINLFIWNSIEYFFITWIIARHYKKQAVVHFVSKISHEPLVLYLRNSQNIIRGCTSTIFHILESTQLKMAATATQHWKTHKWFWLTEFNRCWVKVWCGSSWEWYITHTLSAN